MSKMKLPSASALVLALTLTATSAYGCALFLSFSVQQAKVAMLIVGISCGIFYALSTRVPAMSESRDVMWLMNRVPLMVKACLAFSLVFVLLVLASESSRARAIAICSLAGLIFVLIAGRAWSLSIEKRLRELNQKSFVKEDG